MAALLTTRAAAVAPGDLWFNVNDRRAEAIAAAIAGSPPGSNLFQARTMLAKELLFAGRYADSVALIDELLKDTASLGEVQAMLAEVDLLMLQASTLMRWGEEQNCVLGHNSDSCLLPIKGQGVHTRRDGSTRAIGVLERVLKLDPSNLRARWLLNIAHMTLGSYPDGVRARFLIPPSAFAAAYPLPAFDNVAGAVGLDIYGVSGGAVLEDLDGDGRLDVMVSAIGFADQMRVFRNVEGRFTDVTAASGLTGLTGGLNMVTADYDNDGLLDVLVLRGGWMGAAGQFPMSLLRNRGGMRFDDVTQAAGLLRLRPTQTAAWLDFDGDGCLDLFVGNESAPGRPVNPCELYPQQPRRHLHRRRQGGRRRPGRLRQGRRQRRLRRRRPSRPLRVAWRGRQPACSATTDPGRAGDGWRFTDVAAQAGVPSRRTTASRRCSSTTTTTAGSTSSSAGYWARAAEDVAADYLGRPTTSAERGRLYRNNGDGTFADVTREAGL